MTLRSSDDLDDNPHVGFLICHLQTVGGVLQPYRAHTNGSRQATPQKPIQAFSRCAWRASFPGNGSTHALIMDAGVLDCVLECMCEDFKHFEAHAAAANRNQPVPPRDPGKGSHSHSKTAAAGQVSREQSAQANVETPLVCYLEHDASCMAAQHAYIYCAAAPWGV